MMCPTNKGTFKIAGGENNTPLAAITTGQQQQCKTKK